MKIPRLFTGSIILMLFMTFGLQTTWAATTSYGDEIPDLINGFSDFTGPWAFIFYAKDESTDYIYHEASDGDYYPSRGDLLIIGGDQSQVSPSQEALDTVYTGLGPFKYWHEDTVWNGHILYISEIDDNGTMTCFEGDTIAPYQDLDPNDPEYYSKASIDCIQINYYTGECLTEGKTNVGKIRAFIETGFSKEYLYSIDQTLRSLYYRFQVVPDEVRSEICSLYPMEINWCSIFIHYLLLNSIV